MRMRTKDTIPVLTDKMKELLTSYSNSRTLPSWLVKRSKIVLFAAEGTTNQAISAAVNLHYNNVAVWRKRFLQALPTLQNVEISAPDKLEKEIRTVLSDKKRSGAPATFQPDQIMRIINLACCNPGDYGYEVSQWSLPLLVKEVIKQGIVDGISAKSVSRFLKQGRFTSP